MRVRKKPDVYEAVEQGGAWVVTNITTGAKRILTRKEFHQQFEEIRTRPEVTLPTKQGPKYPPLTYEKDPDTGELKFQIPENSLLK